MTIVEDARAITGGVGTHSEVHVAAALDPVGGLLGVRESRRPRPAIAACWAGCEVSGPLPWWASRGPAVTGRAWPGTWLAPASGSWRQPGRQDRRRNGKSDPLDAVSAARAAQSGRAAGAPKGRDGAVEAIRVLMVAKRSARNERTQAINQARALILTGPDELRSRFARHRAAALAAGIAALRPRPR